MEYKFYNPSISERFYTSIREILNVDEKEIEVDAHGQLYKV